MKKQAVSSKATKRGQQRFPRGWNARRVQQVIAYYNHQTEDEEAAEYEDAMNVQGLTVMLVPTKLVPEIRRLIGRRRGA